GVTALYQAVIEKLKGKGLKLKPGRLPPVNVRASSRVKSVVPPERVRYLAEISQTVRDYHRHVATQVKLARERQQLREAKRMVLERAPSPQPSPTRGEGAGAPAGVSPSSLAGEGRGEGSVPAAAFALTTELDQLTRCHTRSAREEAARHVARHAEGLRRCRVRRENSRQGNPHGTDLHLAVWHGHSQGGAAHLRGPRRDPQVADAGERARLVPLHGRGVRLQARERGSHPHVRRRRR